MATLRWLLAALAALPLCHPAPAASLADTVEALRQECGDRDDTPCASPRVDTIKRHLHALADAEMAKAAATLDPETLARRLSLALPGSDDDGGCSPGPEGSGLGQLRLELRRTGPDVELRSSVGLICAADQSAALYHWSGAGWRPYWRAVQPFKGANGYRPRTLTAMRRDAKAGLVMAAGVEQWCTSNWHRVYYQLWRAAPGQKQRLLLDGMDFAFLSEGNGPFEARLDGADLYTEYMVASLDPARLSRLAVRHYRVEGERVRRLDPIALDPVNFVEEWLGAPWRQSADWTEPAARDAARGWHQSTRDRRTGGSLTVEFDGDKEAPGRALRCRGDRDLWQVAVSFPEARAGKRQAWLLVRWNQPYRFRLAAIAARPWPNCGDDADPDGRQRRLLPASD